MKSKQGKKIIREFVKEFAVKKAGTNCAGLMYEVKKPQMLKTKNTIANHKK